MIVNVDSTRLGFAVLVAVGHWATGLCAQQCESWSPTSVGPSAREGCRMAFDPESNRLLMFGGSSTQPGEVWAWDGSEWSQVSASGPASRRASAVAYDEQTACVVMFGGVCNGGGCFVLGDTWVYSPASSEWTEVLAPGPAPRWNHAMTYDSVRGRVLLAGGGNGASLMNDFWSLSNGAWVQLPNLPVTVSGARIVFDPVRDRVVLFGGQPFSSDVWEFDGDQWIHLPAFGPLGRWNHGMVFVPGRNTVVMFGGDRSGSGYHDSQGDLWEWNGTNWMQLSPGGSQVPIARGDMAFGFDEERSEVMMFGGGTASIPGGLLADSWRLEMGPVVLTQPSDVDAKNGQTVSLESEISGSPSATLRWFHDGEEVVDDDRVHGASTHRLEITAVRQADAGSYVLRVEADCGETFTQPAALTVTCSPDIDGVSGLGVADIFAYLSRWFSGNIQDANYNGDCCVNVADIFAYLSDWFAGCP